jgi:pimeloyl-ACP methyl ester carboxylesterase
MPFLGWLTDRIILQPTVHEIPVPDKKPLRFSHGGGELEVWVHRVGPDRQGLPDLYLLEFPGTASRAEHRTDFVEDCWSKLCVEIWAVNPPGYGNSSGTASLTKLAAMAERALHEVRQAAGEIPVIAAGGSLGSVSALYLAARHRVEGMLVQSPPALREVILAKSVWRHIEWAPRVIAAQIPRELDSIANARRATVPAVFVSAQRDAIVPARVQRQIIDAYNGPSRVLSIPDADHDTPMLDSELEQLRPLTSWLYHVITH